MTIARYITGLDIINRVAPEVGLTPDANAYTSSDPAFVQMKQLLNSCGQDLVGLHEWQQLVVEGTIALTGSPNRYNVPEDFSRFAPQTGYEDGQFRSLGGPLSPQLWAVAVGQDMASPIHIHFREAQNQFWIFPTNTASGPTINYEYIRRTWLKNGAVYKDTTTAAGDIVEFEPVLMVRYLKWKFLAARGFESNDAKADFMISLTMWQGKGTSGTILNLARPQRESHLIQAINAGDTDFGV